MLLGDTLIDASQVAFLDDGTSGRFLVEPKKLQRQIMINQDK